MLKCNGKTFMNLQEAVQWLLNNNALFFMCNEDYAADTEISLSELVNPSPANPKIGSLVLFADGNIATITGITDDSFIVGSDAINIRLDKTVTHFEINASQHLLVHYSDGTSDDLGSILSGNVNIDGTLTANVAKIFEDIVDKDGHERFVEWEGTKATGEYVNVTYSKASLSGTHLMIVLAVTLKVGTIPSMVLTEITLPSWIVNKIFNLWSTVVDYKSFTGRNSGGGSQSVPFALQKSFNVLSINLLSSATISDGDKIFRVQFDLLIDNE